MVVSSLELEAIWESKGRIRYRMRRDKIPVLSPHILRLDVIFFDLIPDLAQSEPQLSGGP